MTSTWPSILAIAPSDSFIDWLLGTSQLSLFDADTQIGWQYPLPAWVWMLIIGGAAIFAAWSYSQLLGGRSTRLILAALRGLLILCLALLIAQPHLIRQDELIENDWLLVLVDRSSSMQIQDVVLDSQSAGNEAVTRDAALRAALAEHAEVFTPTQLGEKQVAWLGFGPETFQLPTSTTPRLEPVAVRLPGDEVVAGSWGDLLGVELLPADQPATALRSAIEQALDFAGDRPVSGIVLMTDGQSPQSTGVELVYQLNQQSIPIFAVPLGSEVLPLDVAVTQVDAPERAFTKDRVTVRATVDLLGDNADFQPQQVRVQLVDQLTGEVLDQTVVQQFDEPVNLVAEGSEVGQRLWQVVAEIEAAALQPMSVDQPARRELVKANNQRDFSIEFIDRPLGVLYVEGYPRWEYRFLKNLLIREESIASSMYLLSADRSFAQEGDWPITRLPDTMEEMQRYDVIIIGDVPPEFFRQHQFTLIREHVASNGAGVLWIAGERDMPRRYEETVLADLLPMREPSKAERFGAQDLVRMQPTPLSRRLNVLQLAGPETNDEMQRDADRFDALQLGGTGASGALGRAEPRQLWPDSLPGLRWAMNPGQLKPTAEVVAEAATALTSANQPLPLLTRLRYGAGQSMLLSTDEIWRWRYGRGGLYFEQFYIQLVRMLGRGRPQFDNDRARLTLSHKRLAVDDAAVVEVTLYDPALIDMQLPRLEITAEQDSPFNTASDSIILRPIIQDTGTPSANQPERFRLTYRGTWRPRTPGNYNLSPAEAALEDLQLAQPLEVFADSEEQRRPETDFVRLAALAQDTGGQVIPINRLNELPALLPNRARIQPDDLREPIWNSPLAMILILSLLTAEWILRKVIRLA